MTFVNPFQKQKPGSGGELDRVVTDVRTHDMASRQVVRAFKGPGSLERRDLLNTAQMYCSDYTNGSPYEHAVFDDFLPEDLVKASVREFYRVDYDSWVTRKTNQGSKAGLGGRTDIKSLIGPNTQKIVDFFQSPRWVEFIEELTGIPNLLIDEKLWGAGPFSIGHAGYLSLHTDFNRHKAGKKFVTPWRRINLLLYLNEDWEEEYGGSFELWRTDQNYSFIDYELKVVPQFNRLAIFSVTDVSIHGHLDLVNHPTNHRRKSISMYYYTKDIEDGPLISPNYHESIYIPGAWDKRTNTRWKDVVPRKVIL